MCVLQRPHCSTADGNAGEMHHGTIRALIWGYRSAVCTGEDGLTTLI